jgi:ornithine cyclodeaminase/alanine dehydrogenase-like protein (mu-crystallin family)
MLILTHDDVFAALPPSDCAAAMAEVLEARARGETYMPLRSVMAPPDAPGVLGLMPAWRGPGEDRNGVFSLKVVGVMPDNPARGLDAHQGVVALFDGENGVPLAVLDASAVTAVRTAAVSAVATATLAREDARVLAIIGAGVQARAHVAALLGARSFQRVRVYAPTTGHAQRLVDWAASRVAAEVTGSAEEAVRGADVVVTATSSRTPVLARAWLGAGVHVNAIGASMPSAMEIDPEVLVASALFADSRESLRNEAGEFRWAVERGLIDGEDHVRAELGEVLAGLAPGRRDDEELTLFRSLGLAVEDLAAAQLAVETARRLGLGVEVGP